MLFRSGCVSKSYYVKPGNFALSSSIDTVNIVKSDTISLGTSDDSGLSFSANAKITYNDQKTEAGWVTSLAGTRDANTHYSGTRYINGFTIGSSKTLTSITNNGTISAIKNDGTIKTLSGSGIISANSGSLTISTNSGSISIPDSSGSVTVKGYTIVSSGTFNSTNNPSFSVKATNGTSFTGKSVSSYTLDSTSGTYTKSTDSNGAYSVSVSGSATYNKWVSGSVTASGTIPVTVSVEENTTGSKVDEYILALWNRINGKAYNNVAADS